MIVLVVIGVVVFLLAGRRVGVVVLDFIITIRFLWLT